MLKKILYVEDDPDIMEIVTFIFDDSKYDFVPYTKAEGLAEFAASESPDLILLDMILGDGTGQEVFEQLKASTPVIFVTGKCSPEELAELKKLGPKGIIPKPFDPLTLIKTIEGIYNS